jgi:multiple sugar transport system ATP-binding protein
MILVGPSGCGKSTTLRMIAGLETLTSGELKIGGEVVNDRTPAQRDVAMVFQSYALYPHMTVAKNMGFALKKAGLPGEEIRRRVTEAAELLGIADQLDRKPANLSGGQRQRVAMGRAIVREPTAFLLDEPLSNLDAKLRIQMRAEITRIQRRLGATTVYVTHDQTEAMTLGDRLAVMNAGVIQQLGPPEDLYDRPRNLFVAGFIGAPPMNFLPGRMEDDRLELPLISLPLDDALRSRIDARRTIVGIRAEDFEDAALVTDGRPGATLTADVDVLESTGSDRFAHIALDHSEAAEAQRAAAELDPDARDVPTPTEIVARLGSASRIREGEQATLWLDTSKLHLFDASTGERL